MSLLENALKDFPKSEIWRLQTDGWQATRGPNNFRTKFYKGMDAGFKFIHEHGTANISPQLIEEMYFSVFQFEEGFETEVILQKGYSETFNAFEIFLPLPGLEYDAAVSENGLYELIEALQKSYNNKGKRQYPQYGIYIETEDDDCPIAFNPSEQPVAQCHGQLKKHLMNASQSKFQYTEEPKYTKLTKVEIAAFNATREEVLQWVQNDIEDYQTSLEHAKKLTVPLQREHAEIQAINHFIRKLYQSRYFPDGNCRVFNFLLANLLLLQNEMGMKITKNPAHYAAFSSEELLKETLNDMALFQEYQITAAKDYLTSLSAQKVTQELPQVQMELLEQLSQDPLIAMAQINEIYEQVKTNRTVCPLNYVQHSLLFSLLKKTDPKVKAAHAAIMNLLKTLYVNQLTKVVDSMAEIDKEKRLGYQANESGAKILANLLKTQAISKQCDEATIKRLIKRYDDNEVEFYSRPFETKPSLY